MSQVLTFLVIGLGVGGAYALAGQGIVLIYRGSGVINFAHGGFAVAAAALFFELRARDGFPASAAMTVALLACAVLGLAVHFLVMRPLRHASPLTRVIATLGVFVVLQQAVNLRFGVQGQFVTPFMPTGTLRLSSTVAVGWDRITIFILAVVLTAGLTVLYRFTDFGRATTSVAENELATMTLGYSPDRVAAFNWMLGAMLAGLSGILLLPIIAQLAPVSIVLSMIPGLAAALVGRFSSFTLTLLGGLVVGITESELLRWVTELPHWLASPGWPTAAPFLVVIIVLVIRGRALPLRGHLLEQLPKVGTGILRPPLIAVGLLIGIGSLFALGATWSDAVATTMITAILCLSVVVLTGFAGQISLAQVALAGFGALIASRLADAAGFGFVPAALLGVAATVPLGLAVAVPALRVRGVNLAVVTLGLAIAIQKLILSNPDYTGGPIRGTIVHAPSLFGWSVYSVDHPGRFAGMILVAFAVLAIGVANLRRGRAGRRLLAVRTNERAAAALGINVMTAKLFAFGLASAIAAVGGIFIAFRNTHVEFSPFDVFASIYVVVWSVIGGVGFVMGAVLGGMNAPQGIGQHVLGQFVDVKDVVLLIGGFLLLLIVVFLPDGQAEHVTRTLGSTLFRRRARLEALPDVARERVRPVTLQVRGLGVRFGGVVALDGADVRVEPGRVVGLIGPNGAGKTTLIDLVAGNLRPRGGVVTLNDRPIERWSVARRARAGLGRSFQSLELFEDMTVGDNLRTAGDRRDVLSYLTDLVHPGRRPFSAVAVAAIRELELRDDLDRMPSELPFGRRRLVAIARALAAGPSVLLLDEPAAGLDEHETIELGSLIRRLADEWGMAVLLVEHDVALVTTVCDEILVLNFGKPLAFGTPAEIHANPDVVAAYLGSAVSEPAQDGPRPGNVDTLVAAERDAE